MKIFYSMKLVPNFECKQQPRHIKTC